MAWSYSLWAQENRAPGAPGEISIADVTAHSARIGWGPASDPDGDPLVYQVWLRKRIEGVAQPWLAPHETRGTNLVWDGLSAATVYDVKVAAWDGHLFGPARIRENAFVTLREPEGNHPPTTPRGMEFSQITAHSVRISWSASTDADNDPITYEVSVRKRVEGEVFEWLRARTTTATSLVWGELESETLYDARVRASDGKSVSRWFLKERAFRTTAETNAPTQPGEITVSAVAATSARIAWGAASGPAGVTLGYEVQVRARLEGVPQQWQMVAETTALSTVASNLRPATVYDVRVRAWAQGVAGAWAAREEAFRTLSLTETNHPPTRPGPLEVAELTPFNVRLAWGPSADPDADRLTYVVCLRKRIGGVAQAWSVGRETTRPGIVWDGLTPNTVYDVRIRAWDGKASSDWFLRENAFVTPAAGDRLSAFVRYPDSGAPDGQRTMLVLWPDDTTETVMELGDSVRQWTPCLEVETDGTINRAQVPMSAGASFFRIRR